MNEAKYYGVSFGNGNDGVSQLHPNFIVRTDDPYELARLAIKSAFKEEYQDWVEANADIDGEAEYAIYATLYEGPNGETEFGASYFIAEIFPCDPAGQRCLIYESLTEAL